MIQTVEQTLTEICNDPQLREKSMCQDTLESMYKYCISIHDGYTKEEFCKFINEMYEYASRKDTKQIHSKSSHLVK